MKRYTADILSEITGLSLIGAALDVLFTGTETRVTLYAADDDGGATVAQPVPNGVAFYVPDGRYDLRAKANGRMRIIPQVDMFDGFEQNRRLEAVENGEPGAPGSLRADLMSPTGTSRIRTPSNVRLDQKLAETISSADEGSGTAAVIALNEKIRSAKGTILINNMQVTATSLVICGAGGPVAGAADGRIISTSSQESFVIGAGDAGWLAQFTPIAANMMTGASTVALSSVAGYVVGQTVLITGGRSVNASVVGGNDNAIPKRKQFFTILAIDSAAKTLSFNEVAQHDYMPGTANLAEHGKITVAACPVATNRTISNVVVSSLEQYDAAYSHFLQFSRVVSVRDSQINGWRGAGALTFCDHVVYDNVLFCGYNGLSTARGTKKFSARDCSYEPRYASPQGIAIFIEESSEDVLIDNFRARGGGMLITSSGDEDVRKNVRISRLDMVHDGKRRVGAGYVVKPSIELSYQNTPSGLVEINGTVVAPGGAVRDDGTAIPKCVTYIKSSRHVRLKGMRFAGLDADAYAIAVDESDVLELEIDDCAIIDGSGLGLCHPSVLTNLAINPATSTVRNPRDLEVAFSTVVSGGTATGRKYVTWAPEQGFVRCRWQFDTLPAGTYAFLTASKSNGAHLYEFRAHRSGSGAAINYSATVSQLFNSNPSVHAEAATTEQAVVSFAMSSNVATTASVTINGGDPADNMVVEIVYRLTKADPVTSLMLL